MNNEVVVCSFDYPNLYGFIVMENSVCRNCMYRKEHYKTTPTECLECGFIEQRNEPYYIRIPVWNDGYVPTKKDIDYFTKHHRVADPELELLPFEVFKSKIISALNVPENTLSFGKMSTQYCAQYHPKYPEESAADMVIWFYGNTGECDIRGNFGSLIPTIKKYKDFQLLLADLSTMDFSEVDSRE